MPKDTRGTLPATEFTADSRRARRFVNQDSLKPD